MFSAGGVRRPTAYLIHAIGGADVRAERRGFTGRGRIDSFPTGQRSQWLHAAAILRCHHVPLKLAVGGEVPLGAFCWIPDPK